MKNHTLKTAAGLMLVLAFLSCSSQEEVASREGQTGLTVLAIGDAGTKTSEMRANANLMNKMYTGQHDGGKFDALIFLGDNFYETGLNVPADDVEGKISSVLDLFRAPMEGIGKENNYAVPGNHDYYARYALEASTLFGLITIEEGPIGLSDKGNERERTIDRWTYYYHMPGEAVYPVSEGAKDSVLFIFFDSARFLRTSPAEWKPALDSLGAILRASTRHTGIAWRVLCLHHPFYSLGEHGGYSIWNDETNSVDYLTACDKDTNAMGWLKNMIDPEDLCTDKYKAYVDSVSSVIQRSKAKVHLMLAGHDHSMQLLSYPSKNVECEECPGVYVVSGAGAYATKVRAPNPPTEFTSFQTDKREQGASLTGFVQLSFMAERIRIRFFDGKRGEPIDMGGGKKEFLIDRAGNLLPD